VKHICQEKIKLEKAYDDERDSKNRAKQKDKKSWGVMFSIIPTIGMELSKEGVRLPSYADYLLEKLGE
jgi:hypothetical protein